MRKTLLFTVILGLLTIWGCTRKSKSEITFTSISMEEAKGRLETEKGYILVDVRTPEEYSEGHIPGAINIPNETIADKVPEELPDKNQLIFVYCRSGRRSKEASGKLAAMGFSNIVEIGGIIDWKWDIEF